MKKHRKKLLYILTIMLSISYIVFARKYVEQNPIIYTNTTPTSTIVKVVKIVDENYEKQMYPDGMDPGETVFLFEGEVTQGYKKGENIYAIQRYDHMYAISPTFVSVGDTVIVQNNPDISVDVDYMFNGFYRTPYLIILGVVFTILLLLFGHMKGFNTLLSLGFTIFSIFYVFIPAILNLYNIRLWAIITCVYIVFMTLLIVSGYNKQSFAAIFGCVFGITVCGVLEIISEQALHLTGLVNSDSMFVLSMNTENPIDLKAVVFSAILIGAVGAIMDIAMSISSALQEVTSKSQNTLTQQELFNSGITIGRDIMGTMANTLILAYIGASLTTTLLLAAYSSNLLILFNTELIVVEILSGMIGMFGVLLTIPLTSLVCSFVYKTKKTYI